MSVVSIKSSTVRAAFEIGWVRIASILVATLIVVGSGFAFYRNEQSSTNTAHLSPEPVRVHSLARLEPKSRVIRLSCPTASEGSRIVELNVAEGDSLSLGQVVAVLDTHDRRRGALFEAEARVRVERAKLAQIQAGAKSGEIAAQHSTVNRFALILKNAETELERFRKLADSKTVSASDFDNRKLMVEQTRQDLEQAKANLDRIREIRDVDIALQKEQIDSAIASMNRAEADLEATLVKSPIMGRVLRIHARPGEKVGDKGLMEIGQIDVMYAVAEVYESDVPRIRVGQPAVARLTGSSFQVTGVVEEIGMLVARKDVLNNDPVSDTDARVVEVRVRLSETDSVRVAGLSNARCEITFEE